jgi:CubicO group peptidase (beta-lactamase class C family)
MEAPAGWRNESASADSHELRQGFSSPKQTNTIHPAHILRYNHPQSEPHSRPCILIGKRSHVMSKSTALLETISQYLEVAGVPGLAFSLIENHQLKSTHVVGVKNFETKEPVVENTVFQAASLSKPVFTYGVLSLQQEGKFNLDKPLDEYLSLPEADGIPQLKRITARQALTHTTGLQNWRFDDEDRFEFAFEPGADFSYSGEGFFYVQRVIEQLTGQSIESFMQERVLRPLGMTNSTYIWRAGLETLVSMGHRDRGKRADPWNMRQGRKLLEIPAQKDKPLEDWLYQDVVDALPQIHPSLSPLPNNMIPNAAGSLLTSAPEYAQFMLRLLDPQDEIARQMLTPQHRLNSALSWGLGIGLEKVDETTCFWHWGDNGFFGNFMFGNPRTGNGIVILTNEVRGLYICERILREVNGHDLSAFLWI